MHNTSTLNSDTANNPIAILESPNSITPETINTITSALANNNNPYHAIACLASVLLLAPGLADHIPLSILDHLSIAQSEIIWENLILLLLHTEKRSSIAKRLQAKLLDPNARTISSKVLRHIFDWFPEELSLDLLRSLVKQSSYAEIGTELLERQIFRQRIADNTEPSSNSLLAPLLSGHANLLVIHNIVDGQGDEIVRVHALLQALLDRFQNLKITILTDRKYLYDHPRVKTASILDRKSFAQSLSHKWDGILNFFEPYLPSNSYNTTIESILVNHLRENFPPFYLWAKKDINHFTFESVIINGYNFAQDWQVNRRRLPFNYETTTRLITKLGLPIRIGENKPVSKPLAVANAQPDIDVLWQSLKADFRTKCNGKDRLIAIVNIFGGYHPMKGFEPANFAQLFEILSQLFGKGYNAVLVPNGEAWGSTEQINTILNCLPEELRKYVLAAPLPARHTPQETMRIIKYFVAWADLVVTIEGWMVHLAYTLGQPYLLLMAPYSYTSEWQPYGCSANQKRWIPEREQARRLELALPNEKSLRPPILHYPEKDLLQAAFEIWAITGTKQLAEKFQYWLDSPDKDIRKWVITSTGKIDALYFQKTLLGALNDHNHEVRTAAAGALLSSNLDLTLHFGPNWQEILLAYQLIGDFRFQDLQPLGHSAYPALKACVKGDDFYVSRDAKIIAELMQLPELD